MTTDVKMDYLQGLWLKQLLLEFEEICYSHNAPLQTPIFEITDSHRVYGCWRAATRVLSLSRRLILYHPWSVTLQVLKHEMAHQLCSEVTHADATTHGEHFQRACEQLGVLPEFRRPGVVMPEMVAAAAARSELSDNGRKCLAKIEKLLALGRSANEHEAALAIEKANELLEKYHLQGLGEGGEHRYACVVIDGKKKRVPSYHKHICSILQRYFFVKIVWSDLYDPLLADTFKTIEMFGTRENVAIAEYCFYFLENRLVLLWSANRHKFRGVAQTEKKSYFLGLLRGFEEKLHEQKKNRQQKTAKGPAGALIVAEEHRLAWFVGLRFPRLRSVSRKGSKIYGRTYEEGIAAGREITLNDAVPSGKPAFAGLLS